MTSVGDYLFYGAIFAFIASWIFMYFRNNQRQGKYKDRLDYLNNIEKDFKPLSKMEKEFRDRLKKEQEEEAYRQWKKNELKTKKSVEAMESINKTKVEKTVNLIETNSKLNISKFSVSTYLTGGVMIVLVLVLVLILNPNKQLALTVPEALKKIKTSEAMKICAGTRGADPRKVAPSDDGRLTIQLIDLSEKEGMEPYVDNSFNKIYYHVVGWDNGSKNSPEQNKELTDGCTYLINNDEEFAKEFNRVWGKRLEQGNKMAAAEKEKEEAEKVKFEPQLEKWNDKFSNLGGGGVVNYLTALAKAENFIQQGAAYSLTGVARGAVQSVSCDPTNRSRWSSGVPTGWWSCLIDFEGSDYDVFSIEFTQNSWRGVPDRGRQAGTDLRNIEIPQDLRDWLSKTSRNN